MATEAEALADWHEFVRVATSTFALAIGAVPYLKREFVKNFSKRPPTPGTPLMFYAEDPNRPAAVAFKGVLQADVPDLLAEDGRVKRDLGRQWLVYVCAGWDSFHWQNIAASKGLKRGQHHDPLMVDLKHIRDDILHQGALATKAHCGACVQLKHWVPVGKEINIDGPKVMEFMVMNGVAAVPHGRGPWHPVPDGT